MDPTPLYLRVVPLLCSVSIRITLLYIYIYIRGFDSCTTPIQQLYNNPSHEGGPQYVGLILM